MQKYEIAKYVAQGMDNEDICMTTGVTAKGLEIIKASPEFEKAVAVIKSMMDEGLDTEISAEMFNVSIDGSWDSLEESTVRLLQNKMSEGLITRTSELIAIARMANSAGRRTEKSAPLEQRASAPTLVVSPLLIANNEQVNVMVDTQNRVIGINDRSIQTASRDQVNAKHKELMEARAALSKPPGKLLDDSKKVEESDLDPDDL